jgi:hypothetical protein
MSGSGTWGAGTWGQNQWNDLADPTFTVTGIALTASLGDESSSTEVNVGWGRVEWGKQAWGIAGTLIAPGDAVTANLGSVTTTANANTGPSTNNNQTITGALGSVAVDIAVVVFPSGLPATTTLGTADASPDALATTNHATMSLGTVDAYNQTGWGRQQWNVNAWGVEGQYANVDVTGIAMTATAGTLAATGNANITANTLNVAQATLGVVDPAPDATVTGNFMIGALGTLGMQGDVPQDVTGIAMSAGLGSVVAVPGQEVLLTGLPALARLASPSYIIHVDVLVTGNSLTMAQGSGSALIWNEVNTGTAPIDPPGWQEVAA